MKKTVRTLGVIALAGSMGVTLGASTVIKDIKAQINPAIKYEINGEAAMEGKAGILYEDTMYIPLRAAAETLGLDVHYEAGKITMNSKKADEAEEVEVSTEETVVVEEVEEVEDKEEDKEETDKEAVEEETEAEVQETEEDKTEETEENDVPA